MWWRTWIPDLGNDERQRGFGCSLGWFVCEMLKETMDFTIKAWCFLPIFPSTLEVFTKNSSRNSCTQNDLRSQSWVKRTPRSIDCAGVSRNLVDDFSDLTRTSWWDQTQMVAKVWWLKDRCTNFDTFLWDPDLSSGRRTSWHLERAKAPSWRGRNNSSCQNGTRSWMMI